ncbi:MAG: sunset domain-containing protein [Syntrophales bacterium]
MGNSDSKRYHLPGMKYYHKVKAYHQVIFNSETEAIKAGYTKARE